MNTLPDVSHFVRTMALRRGRMSLKPVVDGESGGGLGADGEGRNWSAKDGFEEDEGDGDGECERGHCKRWKGSKKDC